MRRSSIFAFAASIGVIASAFSGLTGPTAAAAASNPAAASFDDAGYEFTPAITPGSLDPNRKVTVMLEMSGDPVAVVQSTAPGKVLPDSQRQQIESDLGGRQESIKPSIAASGATVVGQYQDAYNGIKVVVPASGVGSLGSLPGVVAVHPVATHTLDNAVSVPFIGAPAAWTSTGFHGDGVKVAVVDTGIDYTHANFGGTGSAAAYQAALAADTQPANPALFGPNAPKVKGGIDLVGDDYDAASSDPAKLIPHPDPNPLDCYGHGSHVAGTIAGFGVTAAGATYRGSYDSSIYTPGAFTIGPGVAPKADLYAVRVFGCNGSTNVVTDALDWSVRNGMQVVNMSLGSSYGNPGDPDVTATNNAVAAGILVVASAGNSGASPYIVGSPSIAGGAISVAATDSTGTFPGAILNLGGGRTVNALNANSGTLPAARLPVTVLRTAGGAPSLGCNPSDYENPSQPVAGHIVVTARGVCARILRAQLGYQHHAAAVVMTNNAPGYPPYEGPIDGVPSSMPFIGVAYENRAAVRAATSIGLTAFALPNPGYRQIAGFSSSGPARVSSALKPDITAPGVAVVSTGMGTGNGGATFSGTSMAAPHVSGVAALTIQAHPGWDTKDLRAAIVNTGDPGQVSGYISTAAGSGLVQPNSAVHTSVTVERDLTHLPPGNGGQAAKATAGPTAATSVSFGFAELTQDFSDSAQLLVLNHGDATASFAATVEQADPSSGSSPHTASVDRSSFKVGGGKHAILNLSLSVPAATAGDSSDFRQVRGTLVLAPTAGTNAGVALRIPYSLVLRPRSTVVTQLSAAFSPASPKGTATITNPAGAIPGNADFYSWDLAGSNSAFGPIGLRAAGFQSVGTPLGIAGVIAINTFARWSTPDTYEFDVAIDTRGGSNPNFYVVGADHGLLTAGQFDGVMAVAVFNLTTGRAKLEPFGVSAPTDGSTIELPFLLSDLNINAAHPRMSYSVASFDNRDGAGSDQFASFARINAVNPSISTGQYDTVAPGGTMADAVAITPEWATTPSRGLMIVTLDNAAGAAEAQLIPVS